MKKTCKKIQKRFRKKTLKAGQNTHKSQHYENNSTTTNPSIVDSIENKVTDISSSVANDIYDNSKFIVDKGKDELIQNINDFIESPKISQITEAGENYLSDFNDRIDNPVFKKQVSDTLDNVADYADITLKAMDKPIDEAIDKLNESGTKAASGTVSSIIKVGTDALAAIPGLGAVIELGKIANDASKGVSSVVEASAEAAETADDFLKETNQNIDKLKHSTQQGGEILTRTMHSIDNFQKIPLPSSMKGGNGYYKTKKRLLRRKNKTKRVRFNIQR
jgi:hypothetical protein